MAKRYRRPLLTFYLPRPPRAGFRGQDFRTLPAKPPVSDEALLDALIRDVNARHQLLKSALEDEGALEPLPYVGSKTLASDPARVAESIALRLGVNRDAFRAQKTTEAAFSYLRAGAEQAGVFVLLVGDLGNYHSALPVETYRGFSIADPIAPFIVLNDQDARSAWSFTLLHELAHIWLGQSGISGGRDDQEVEKFCNEVAAAFLMDAVELDPLADALQGEDLGLVDELSEFAGRRNLSRKMVAYALLKAGLVSHARWARLDAELTNRWLKEKQKRKADAKTKDGAPDYYTVRRHRLGSAMLSAVRRNLSNGNLTVTKAAKVLGVKPRSVTSLLSKPPALG